MRVVIRPDYDQVSHWVASYVKARITNFAPTAERPFVLGLVHTAQHHTDSIAPLPALPLSVCPDPAPAPPPAVAQPTGSSPLGTYRYLVEFFQRGELSFKHVITFNMGLCQCRH